MRICIFDTETVSLEKPFCYNVGYVIYDTESSTVLHSEEFVVEQIWHNDALFCTSYYADKKPLYINRMKAQKVRMEKWGYITQKMCRAFRNYNVEIAFAYNSSFDEKVFDFNCDWFKTINPFDNVKVLDIRGYVHSFISCTEAYQAFCEEHKLFTESGNYSTTAEAVYKYLTGNTDFIEEHTALADAEIELDILLSAVVFGAVIGEEYPCCRSIARKKNATLTVITKDKVYYQFNYDKITINKDKTKIILK